MNLDRKLQQASVGFFYWELFEASGRGLVVVPPLLDFIQRFGHYNRRADSIRGNGIWQADETRKALQALADLLLTR